MFDTTTAQLPAPTEGQPIPSTLDALASLPDEEVWLASRKSRETRHAHAGDVRRFMRLLGITSREASRQVDRKIMLANGAKLKDFQRTIGHADPATTQLYDRGRFTPQKSAALLVAY